MLFHRRKVIRPRLQIDFVRGPREVPNDQLVLWIRLMQIRLKESEVLPAIQQRVSDKRDPRSFFQLQRQLGFNRLRLFGIRRGFFVDRKFSQRWIFFDVLLDRLVLGIFNVGNPRICFCISRNRSAVRLIARRRQFLLLG